MALGRPPRGPNWKEARFAGVLAEAPVGGVMLWKAPLGPVVLCQIQISLTNFQFSCSRMYLRTRSSFKPTVLAQHPVAQKCRPVIRRSCNRSRCILTALLPFRNPIVCATLYFGGMLNHMWTWSTSACPSIGSTPRCTHRSRNTDPIRTLSLAIPMLRRWRCNSHGRWC